MKTYVDGFNLFGAIEGRPPPMARSFRAMPAHSAGERHRPDQIFTAKVTSRPNKPAQAERQAIYLRDLRTIPNLEIIFGHFSAHRVSMYDADSNPGRPRYVDIIKTEEKGSDINIATVEYRHLAR